MGYSQPQLVGDLLRAALPQGDARFRFQYDCVRPLFAAASTHPEAVSSNRGYGTGVDLFTGKARALKRAPAGAGDCQGSRFAVAIVRGLAPAVSTRLIAFARFVESLPTRLKNKEPWGFDQGSRPTTATMCGSARAAVAD